MQNIFCFLKHFWRGAAERVTNKICVKIKPKQQNQIYRTKRTYRPRQSMTQGRVRPKKKNKTKKPKKKTNHAINSVYYRFYITFLSIHIHIIIHTVLWCSHQGFSAV